MSYPQNKDDYTVNLNLSKEKKADLLKAITEKDKVDWKGQANLILNAVCGIPISIKLLSNIIN
jgi:hypothetical protein